MPENIALLFNKSPDHAKKLFSVFSSHPFLLDSYARASFGPILEEKDEPYADWNGRPWRISTTTDPERVGAYLDKTATTANEIYRKFDLSTLKDSSQLEKKIATCWDGQVDIWVGTDDIVMADAVTIRFYPGQRDKLRFDPFDLMVTKQGYVRSDLRTSNPRDIAPNMGYLFRETRGIDENALVETLLSDEISRERLEELTLEMITNHKRA